MDFALKRMDFTLKRMIFVFKMMDFVFNPSVSADYVAAAEVVAAAEAQSVVLHRVSFQEAANEEPAGSGAAAVSGGQNAATMAVGDAQKTSVLRIANFLSKEEVAEIHAEAGAFVAEQAAQKDKVTALNLAPSEFGLNPGAPAGAAVPMAAAAEAAAGGPLAPVRSSPQWETGRKVREFCIKNDEFCIKNDEICIENDELCQWNVSFLHKEGMFKAKLPIIRARILELGRKSDRENWGQMKAAGLEEEELKVRTFTVN